MRRALAVAAGLAVAACTAEPPPPVPVRPALLVQVAPAGAREAAVYAGEVRPRHETDLAFRIGGKLVERRVDVGATVRRGQVLARVDPADVALQVEAQSAAVAAARTDEAYARAEFARYEHLHRQAFVSASALDQKRSAMNAAAARREQAEATLAVTRNQAGYATLVAPADGVVTAVAAEAGQVVALGQPVMRLAQTGEREVLIAVPEQRLGELTAARELVVALWARPQQRYAARVREVAPAVDAATRTFAVRVAVPGADAAFAWGMTANVAVLGAPAGGVAVPLTALYHAPDGRAAVWVVDRASGKVAVRPVEIGRYREDAAVVARGLAEGEWIVAAGVHRLTEGQVVRPYGGGPPRAAADAAVAADDAAGRAGR